MKRLEIFVESIILASRWLLVAFYIGLGIALAFYAFTFAVKLWDFGSHLMGRFRALYPPMFAAHADLFDFLASVDSGIHREVKKLYPAAILPRVHVVERAPGRIVLAYVSPRHLDDLAAGLIEGAAREFATPVEIQAAPGEHEGQPALVFDVRRVG